MAVFQSIRDYGPVSLLCVKRSKIHLCQLKGHSSHTRSAVSGNMFLPGYELTFTQKFAAVNGARLWTKSQSI